MSKRKGSLLGRARSVSQRIEATIEPPEAEPKAKRSSVTTDPRIVDRLGDAAHYLGRTLTELSASLLARGLERWAEREPGEARRVIEKPTGPTIGGHVEVDISRVGRAGSKRRRTALALPADLRERLADEAFRLRRSQKELLGEMIREGLRELRAAEAAKTGNETFDWPRRPSDARGRRWK